MAPKLIIILSVALKDREASEVGYFWYVPNMEAKIDIEDLLCAGLTNPSMGETDEIAGLLDFHGNGQGREK